MTLCHIKRLFLVIALITLAGCASVTGGDIGPEISTNVVLSEANFVVVSSVEGTAADRRFMGLGLSNRRLYARAKQELVEEAELIGQSRALVNVTVDVETSFFWIFQTKRVTVSAEVVEFYYP